MGIYNATINEQPTNRFAGLLSRLKNETKAQDRKFEVLEEVKTVLNFDTLEDLPLSSVQALFTEILRDSEVAQYADRITFAEVFGYSAPKATSSVTEGVRKRVLAKDMDRLREAVPTYFDEHEGKQLPMSQIVADVLDMIPEGSESAVKQVVRELIDAKMVITDGLRRNMTYSKAAAKQKKAG